MIASVFRTEKLMLHFCLAAYINLSEAEARSVIGQIHQWSDTEMYLSGLAMNNGASQTSVSSFQQISTMLTLTELAGFELTILCTV